MADADKAPVPDTPRYDDDGDNDEAEKGKGETSGYCLPENIMRFKEYRSQFEYIKITNVLENHWMVINMYMLQAVCNIRQC